MQIPFVILIFLLFSIVLKPIVCGGRGKLLEGKASSQPNNVSKHRTVVFKGNANKFLYRMPYYNYEYVENIKTGINFLYKRQIS